MPTGAIRDGTWAATSYTTESLITFDERGQATGSWSAADFNAQSRFVHDAVDSHEVYQINSGVWDGALAIITWTVEYFPSGTYKLGNGIVETVRGLGYRLGPAQAPEEAAS